MPNSPTASPFHQHPLLLLGVYFAGGIVLAPIVDPTIASVGFLTSLAIALVLRTSARLIVPLLFIPLGFFCYQVELSSIAADRVRTIYSRGDIASGEPVEIEGVLTAFAEPTYDGHYLLLRTERLSYRGTDVKVSGTVRLFAPGGEVADFRYGERIRAMCRMLREDQFQNPGVRSRVAILDEQGIDATATIKSPMLIERLGSDSFFIPLAWLHESRRSLIDAFHERFSPSTSGVLIASLLGDKHFLDRRTADVFREGGTFHVLVISGLHITFIGGLTYWAVSLFTRREVWRCVLPAAFLWAYTLAVGAEIPVVRASLMFSMLLFGRLIHRTGSLLNVLGGCVLVLLAWRPSDLFSASFQLTIVSVVAIVGCVFPLIEKLRAIGNWTPTTDTPLPPNVSSRLRRFCEALYWNEAAWQIEQGRQIWSANLFKSPYLAWMGKSTLQGIATYLFEGLLVSFAVQLWMLPFLVIYFHLVSPSSLFLNLWVGVFIALESFAAAFALLFGAVSPWLASPLVVVTEFFNSAMLWLPSVLSGSGWAGFRLPVYSGPGRAVYFLYAATVIVATVKLFRWRPFALGVRRDASPGVVLTLIAACLLLVIVLHPFSLPPPDGKLTVDFLDVGQGDSALVTFPTGETMLVDGGGQMSFSADGESTFEPDRMRIGEAVVSEFLWERGYSRIDLVLATHADADHIEGLRDILRNFDVGTLLLGNSPGREAKLRDEIISAADANEVNVKLVGRGDMAIIGNARIEFLNPPVGVSGSDNDSSVVVRITYGDRSFLLTGDIERHAENGLVTQQLRSDVVKVAHHGSRTSSTEIFIDNARPEIAVISVGKRSRFGHPHAEVVCRWVDSGAAVMTTGDNGTITISTDGRTLDTRTFVP